MGPGGLVTEMERLVAMPPDPLVEWIRVGESGCE